MRRERTLWEKDDVRVGELVFGKGKKTKKRRFVELKGGVAIIVPVEGDSVYLIKEYRSLIKRTVWRLPAGHVRKGERPTDASRRELLEEAGLKAGKMALVKGYEYMEWVRQPIFIFKATALKRAKQELEFYEDIEVKKVSRKEAIRIALNDMAEPHHAFALLKVLL